MGLLPQNTCQRSIALNDRRKPEEIPQFREVNSITIIYLFSVYKDTLEFMCDRLRGLTGFIIKF